MLPGDDEDDLEQLEEFDNGSDEEDEGDEGPGREGGQEGREGETEDEPGPDEDETEPQRPNRVEVQPDASSRQRRSQSRWQKREQELETLRTQKAEAEARANHLAAEQQRAEAQRQQALQQQREQRRQEMTPDERTADELGELRSQINFQRQMDQFQRNDDSDKARFDAKCSVDKVYKRHSAAVETELRKCRAAGWNLPRDEILANIIGKEVMGVSERSNGSQPARRRAVSKPINSRGDGTSAPSRRGPSSDREALKKRLENVPL